MLLEPETITFDNYKKNNTRDMEYNEVMKYIKDSSYPYDESKKAKLNIRIENHAFPLIQLAPNSVIYQDNTIVFNNASQNNKMVHTIIERPLIKDYKEKQLHEHIYDKKSVQSRVSECTVDLVANQWSFLYWKSYFNGPFLHFCKEGDMEKDYYRKENKFQLKGMQLVAQNFIFIDSYLLLSIFYQ